MSVKSGKTLYQNYQKPRKILVRLVPIQTCLAVVFLALTVAFSVLPNTLVWTVVCGVLAVATIAWLVLSWRKCIRDEYALCKDAFAYLWQKDFADGEEFETVDEETGIAYTVQKDGLKIVFPVPEGYVQVFDEAPDNIEFLPWSSTRLALATCNTYFFARLALAVLDVRTALMEGDGETSYEEPFFVPVDERLVRAIKSFGLEEKTCENWAYLFYNPDDALRQIYKRGYIRVMRDRKTGKPIPLED